jgi:hypothetical protein
MPLSSGLVRKTLGQHKIAKRVLGQNESRPRHSFRPAQYLLAIAYLAGLPSHFSCSPDEPAGEQIQTEESHEVRRSQLVDFRAIG